MNQVTVTPSEEPSAPGMRKSPTMTRGHPDEGRPGKHGKNTHPLDTHRTAPWQPQHHCRKCGQAVCGKCSSKRSSIPLMGFEFEVRVCDNCFGSITDEDRAPTATFHDSKHNIVYMHYEPTTGCLLTSGTDKIIKLWDMTAVVS